MIVSFQGSKISSGQRRTLDFQNRCKPALLSPALLETVSAVIKVIDARKEQGVKPERVWSVEFESAGTCSVAEWMGY